MAISPESSPVPFQTTLCKDNTATVLKTGPAYHIHMPTTLTANQQGKFLMREHRRGEALATDRSIQGLMKRGRSSAGSSVGGNLSRGCLQVPVPMQLTQKMVVVADNPLTTCLA